MLDLNLKNFLHNCNLDFWSRTESAFSRLTLKEMEIKDKCPISIGVLFHNLDYVHTMPLLLFENGTKSLRKSLLFTRCRHENHLKTVRNENGTLIGMKWKRNSIRHRVNTCQSVTESWRYQVRGAVVKSYRHRVNGGLRLVSEITSTEII